MPIHEYLHLFTMNKCINIDGKSKSSLIIIPFFAVAQQIILAEFVPIHLFNQKLFKKNGAWTWTWTWTWMGLTLVGTGSFIL